MAAPEGNGCAERFIRTLKEQLLWVEPFETVQQLRLALLAFKDRYNQKWLVERHGHRTPAAVRQERLEGERLHGEEAPLTGDDRFSSVSGRFQ